MGSRDKSKFKNFLKNTKSPGKNDQNKCNNYFDELVVFWQETLVSEHCVQSLSSS